MDSLPANDKKLVPLSYLGKGNEWNFSIHKYLQIICKKNLISKICLLQKVFRFRSDC